jgi:K+-sensing histidine kinase KdpD
VHEGGDDRWIKILVGTDTSASADLAVQAAAEPARASDAELLVLHVCDPNSSHDAADSRRVICALHRGRDERAR